MGSIHQAEQPSSAEPCVESNGAVSTEWENSQCPNEVQHLQSRVYELMSQTEFYRKELRGLQKRNLELKRHMDSIKNVEATARKSDTASLEAKLLQYDKEIQCLRMQLDDKTVLQPFTKTDYKYPSGPDRKEVEDTMARIEASTFNLLASPDTTIRATQVDINNKGADLLSLWISAFGDPVFKVSGVPFQAILRSLTSAAVCKWVLEPPQEDPFFLNSQRGEVILKHIATQGLSMLVHDDPRSDKLQMVLMSLAASTSPHLRQCPGAKNAKRE